MESISMFDFLYDRFKITKPIRLIELFGGVGSQAMALREIGADFEHYKLVEFDKYAIQSYNAVHNTEFEVTDITEVKGSDLEVFDTDKYEYIMTYSFPCQDLSVAGKMKGMNRDSGTRSGLLWEVERLLHEVDELPQVLLMENVPQVLTGENEEPFKEWFLALENMGYQSYYKKLNAKDYGMPQNRDRVFMVSILGDYSYKFPQPIKLETAVADYLEDEVDEKYYIENAKADQLIEQLIEREVLSGEKTVVDGTIKNPSEKQVANCIKARYDAGIENQQSVGTMVAELNKEAKPTRLGGLYDSETSKRQAGTVWDKDAIAPTIDTMQGGYAKPMIIEDTVKIKQATKQGYIECKLGGVADLSYPTSELRRGRVQGGGDISPTLTAQGNGVHRIESEYRIRKLTPKEVWRLMGFSDTDFEKAEKVCSNTQLYKQAGNSIVRQVLEAIFRQMM